MPSLFSTPKTPSLPAEKPPTPMPDPEATDLEKRKKLARRVAASGRASTFLSSESSTGATEKLGG